VVLLLLAEWRLRKHQAVADLSTFTSHEVCTRWDIYLRLQLVESEPKFGEVSA
jgi:hypothetical protein